MAAPTSSPALEQLAADIALRVKPGVTWKRSLAGFISHAARGRHLSAAAETWLFYRVLDLLGRAGTKPFGKGDHRL